MDLTRPEASGASVERRNGPENGLFVVCGAMRSGTTLLQKVICNSPEVNPYIHASRYLMDQLQIHMRYSDSDSLYIEDYFGGVKGLEDFTRQILNAFLLKAWNATGQPKALVLKNPELSFFAPALAELLPEVKFIFSVREPKDTITSMIKVGERMKQKNIKAPLSRAGRNVEVLSRMFNNHYVPVLNAIDSENPLFAGNVLFVRYEDIVYENRDTLERIQAFCGLSKPLGEFDGWRKLSGSEKLALHPKWHVFLTDLYEKPISTESVGAYKNFLTQDECRQIDFQCRTFRKRFSYSS